ncbi:prepilin peptidase [Vibrio breoganii]
MFILYWGIFFSIALCDLNKHRIPNVLLVMTILIRLLEVLIYSGFESALQSIYSACVLFAVGLGLFFIRAMSPGDVKLLFVVGLVTGSREPSSLLYWILVSGGVVAFFYYHYNQASSLNPSSIKSRLQMAILKVPKESRSKQSQKASVALTSRYQDKLVMPFAPSIVIGMAMFYYFN